ncbi:MAG TPA: TolC family protein [Candidatus Acidoferrales bacterium]|nr:TolC family protein [Candidatus Acidoferrales bacterium]
MRLRSNFGVRRVSLLAVLFLFAPEPARPQSSTISSPGQAIPGTLGTNPFASSAPAKPTPGTISISLQEAIDRGLQQNLGLLLSNAEIGNARGQRWEQLSALLPQVTADPHIEESKINLKELGISISVPGLTLPAAVGPFSYFDARLSVQQSLFNWKSIENSRAAAQNVKSAAYTYKDARDLVVLAVGYTYLQAIANEARIDTAEAQVKTAQALFDQASDQVTAGTSPAIDALRAKVELQTRQQQLIQARNNLAIEKLTVARVIGLAPGQEFELSDKSLYSPFEGISVEEALKRAYASRADYQSAESDVRAAEFVRKAATAGYFPSLSFSADYGTGGAHPSSASTVYDVRGTLSIPIFTGGSVHGDVLSANARLAQSRQRLDSLRAQIDADVRTALLNLQSSAEEVNVARSNIDLAEQTLTQSRDRFAAGVADTVEVVQSQEAVASAHEQYISSLYNFNSAKISLARAIGGAQDVVKQYFRGK